MALICALIIHFQASQFVWTTELSYNRKWMRMNIELISPRILKLHNSQILFYHKLLRNKSIPVYLMKFKWWQPISDGISLGFYVGVTIWKFCFFLFLISQMQHDHLHWYDISYNTILKLFSLFWFFKFFAA